MSKHFDWQVECEAYDAAKYTETSGGQGFINFLFLDCSLKGEGRVELRLMKM